MRWIGALPACADSTMRMMRASVVSVPTASVSMASAPSALIEPPVTLSPRALATGRLSPVISDSSTWLRPSTTSPSTGRRSPGRTSTRSPTTTCCDRQLLLDAIAQHPRRRRPQRVQRTDGLGGLPLGAAFEPFAEQHQRDDRGRGLEVQVRHAGAGVLPQQVQRQAIGRRGADRHQQIHVAGAGAQRHPAGAVEAPAEEELHRRGQHQLQPAAEHPVRCRTAAAASARPAATSARCPAPPATRREAAPSPARHRRARRWRRNRPG